MDKGILLIGEKGSSFITNAIQSSLKESGYAVSYAEPLVNEINKEKDNTEIFLLYAGNYIKESVEVLFYIKDVCVEEEKKLYLIGYKEEIADILEQIPHSIVKGTFERPLNVKELSEQMDKEMKRLSMEGNKKHILVVDDSGNMLRTVKMWLSEKYKVSMASSGAMAISFLATNKPDLILLDYEMPICSGPQVMEMIHAEPATSTIPIMFLTSKDDRESVERVLSLRPAGYMLKTMKPDEIIRIIDEFFEKRKGA